MIQRLIHMRQILEYPNSQINHFRERIAVLRQWDRLVKRFIPEEFHHHCQVINVRKQCLVLEVRHAAWATRLRYLIPQLKARLQCENLPEKIEKITCCIAKKQTESKTTTSIDLPLSTKSVNTLQTTATNMTCPSLKKALQDLSNTLKQRLSQQD